MKRIVLVTGSRADYGIMKRLMHRLDDDGNIELDIIATAMHMEKKYGETYKAIEADGFSLFKKIPLDMHSSTSENIVSEISQLSLKLSEVFSHNHFDLMVILGDRYEMLAAANTATIYKIPICHLHGGEKTLGNYDEFIRNAITKMSHLHLTSTERYRQRVIQMGEAPSRVVNTGSLGVENVLKSRRKSFPELLQDMHNNTLKNKNYYVFLYHPVTLESQSANLNVEENLLRLMQDENCVFIGSNSDTGSDAIMGNIMRDIVNNKNHFLFNSLSTEDYHALIRYSNGLIGNSSSGIIEVPSLGVPTLNVGNRQKGRERGKSVIDVSGNDYNQLRTGFIQMKNIDTYSSPYKKDNSSLIAYSAIKEYMDNYQGIEKDFFDVKFTIVR